MIPQSRGGFTPPIGEVNSPLQIQTGLLHVERRRQPGPELGDLTYVIFFYTSFPFCAIIRPVTDLNELATTTPDEGDSVTQDRESRGIALPKIHPGSFRVMPEPTTNYPARGCAG